MIIERMTPSAEQLQHRQVYVVKLQTTGTEPEDEILELCLLDARDPWRGGDRSGPPRPLFHARFRPEYRTEWPAAARVNGITPSMVARERLLDERRDELAPLFMRCDCLVSYNAGFDFAFLRRQFLFRAGVMTVDLMRDWTGAVAGDAAKDGVDIPFLPQKDMFRHFGCRSGGSALDDCLALRHCFLQLIRRGAVHIRRPLLERRRSRASEAQLAEVQAAFAAESAAAGQGPYLEASREGEDVRVTLGVRDPAGLLYAGEAPSASVTVSGAGSAAELRARAADALAACGGLPPGLVHLARDILLGVRAPAEEKVEMEEGAGRRLDDGAAPGTRAPAPGR